MRIGRDGGRPTVLDEVAHSGLPSADFAKTVRVLLATRLEGSGLAERMPPGMLDDIYLAASELANNACEATPLEAITFRALFGARSVRVGVWDSSNATPQPKQVVEREPHDIEPDLHALDEGYESEDIGGWGLALVMALTGDRKVELTPPQGKWVSATFSF
ncbi:ATP-binding protein [Actinomadura sp. NBRC 104412]|uniref:ATP-binding protein n=1 Tax=Actinomadura sp. NBRC 104412 TaxID=3032203 RepID=UPI002553E71E|nr:ATP-binding protein [Actinomadura sp. NBRC 104412]